MRKTEYRDISGAEALRLMSSGEETESLETENKWRRFRLKKPKEGSSLGDQPSKLLYHKKGEWRDCPYALEQLMHREWRTRRKLMMQSYVTHIIKDEDTGNHQINQDFLHLMDFPDGARVKVTIQELDDG